MSMSIDNYVGQLGDLYNNANNTTASKLENSLSTDYAKASDEELMEVCKQFEAYFLEQVMKGMESIIPKSDEDEDSSMTQTVDFFKDTMYQELASKSTETQGLGLAQTLYESMKREYKIERYNL